VAMLLAGRVQSGKGDASRWLALFNTAYSRKTGMPVFAGSLNVALDARISDVALAKACRQLQIPKPPRGYWAKKAGTGSSATSEALAAEGVSCLSSLPPALSD
jgi:hypothetical protein